LAIWKFTRKYVDRGSVDGTDALAITRSGCDVVVGLNVAVTLVEALSVTLQVLVPLHPPPLQPANLEPELGLAVSVTLVPDA
jgi:hypothetical protein